MSDSHLTVRLPTTGPEPIPLLTQPIIAQIDRALRRVGEFGEVRLVVAKGRVRFIETTRSEPAVDGDVRGDQTA
jgi:hypothetical protein